MFTRSVMGSLFMMLAVKGVAESEIPGAIRPEQLYCEYIETPRGIEVRQPRLTWTLTSAERDQRQTAYQVMVATAPDKLEADSPDLWDSGKVESDQTAHIVYAGEPLASRTPCYWKVRVWDANEKPSDWSEPAFWSMGLLDPEDWQAEWIAAPFTGEQPRRAHNGFHTQFASEADSPKWVVVDLQESHTIDSVCLHPARPHDWHTDVPGFLFPMRYRIEASEEADFESVDVLVDEIHADVPNPGETARDHQFEPVSARFIRLYVTKLPMREPGEYAFALAQLEVLKAGENIAKGMPVIASDSVGGTWSEAALTNGITVPDSGTPGRRQPVAMLRSDFHVDSDIVRATLYASALGVYEARINGEKVGDHILAPEWTDYHKRIQYQTYDVTHMLQGGSNTLGAYVGDGWYAGRIGLAFIVPGGPSWGIYGSNPTFIAQLEIETTDGQKRIIATDDTWRATREGPIRQSDMLDGEIIDHRLAQPEWDSPEYDDAAWEPAVVEDVHTPLVAQPNEPIRVIEELSPVALTEPKPGVFIFDLGQNMVGGVRFTASAPEGTTVTLRHGEMLNPDGTLYTENLRTAAQTNRFTFSGNGIGVFEPRFTYHGFRYVEVTGLSYRPADDAVLGRVFNSSAPETGAFTTSDEMLNQLEQNILWTQRANLMSSPTDCPQRDERLGWMGDIQTFSQTAIFNMNMGAFFTKWLADVRDAQADDGRFPDFAPHPFGPNKRFSGAPAWGDAGVIIPWRMYENYGDTRILEVQFDAARRWIDSIHRNNPDHIWRHGRYNDYNDWLNGDTLILDDYPTEGSSVPNEVFATAFYAHSTELLSRMAHVIGKKEEAQRYGDLAAEIRSAFWDAFGDESGRIHGDTQAGYALALHFNLVPESLRSAAIDHLVEALDRYDGRLATGIHSTPRLMLELTRNGLNDQAYALALSRTRPSWGYAIDLGATTIWERWDGYVEGRGFQNPGMNSFNHWALGSVGEWLYQVVGGIRPRPIGEKPFAPGFEHFIIRPQPGGDLTHGEAAYDSIRGTTRSSWSQGNGVFRLSIDIPPNTKATVYLPSTTCTHVTESGNPIETIEAIKILGNVDDALAIEVPSGAYIFEVIG